MQLHLDGSNQIKAHREKVFSMLTDSRFLASTIPDAEEVRVIDGDTLEAKLKLKVAIVSSTMRMKMTITGREPPSKATLVAEGTGSGSNLRVTSVFTLENDMPTKLTWSADAEISGVIAGLGSTLLKGFATKKVAEIFDGITRNMEAATN
ncbi:MAG TPA: carbon monoxide dehydrogenase subunit G [Nitrososphaerales archaeon]|nr:carbon monoxide dehydrogenase subunit G [Nitrososphaerales archaeon]